MKYLFILPSLMVLLSVDLFASPGYTPSEAKEINDDISTNLIVSGEKLNSDLISIKK